TSGSIQIFGHDVLKDPNYARSVFGLTGQYASVDEDLSAKENLMIFSRLNGLSRKDAKKRTQELLEEFSLTDSADKAIENFSGGMRRRLDLAVSLIARPAIIFLDEPTTGLDPRTRLQMWDTIRALVDLGSTIILTTQYLEEADQLADRVALIDHGKLVTIGTPLELKEEIGGLTLHMEFKDREQTGTAVGIIETELKVETVVNDKNINVPIKDVNVVSSVLQKLNEVGLDLSNLNIEQPSLDDVFLKMTVGKN
ncbi:MAG: ATP-binding cassette domain-containing protein, partial [Lactobacillaceae bacterium]|nr:ATP-binding cassette domain-containing protein [Lactobacillaceae bacterium]